MTQGVGIPPENIRYIVCIFLCACCYLTTALLLYCLYIFNKIKVLIIYKKRYPLIVKIECYMCLIMCSVIWPLWILNASQFADVNDSTYINFNTIFSVNHIIYPYCGHAVTMMEAARLWTMYFKIYHMNAVSNNQWKSVIDNNSTLHNWYIKHHNTYGNIRWVIKHVFILYVSAATISMILVSVFGFTPYTQCVDCFFYMIPIFTILYLYYMLLRSKSLIHDNFLFYYEFKTSSMVLGVGVILYAFTAIAFFLDSYYANLWTAILGVTILTGPTLVSALYIPRIILHNDMWYNSNNDKDDAHVHNSHNLLSLATLSSISSTATISPSPSPTAKAKDPKKVSLDEIFMDKLYTEYFIQHIIKEFSLECVLSYIEMMQFKGYLYKTYKSADLKDGQKDDYDPTLYALQEHIPHSTIVYGDDPNTCDTKKKILKHFKNIYVALYDKYISDEAEYQVNISYELKTSHDTAKTLYASDSWNINETELMNVFNDVITDMKRFMSTSLQRFLHSVEFEQINM